MLPVSSNGLFGVISPYSSPAVAVTSLNVDPGAYCPWMARSSNGSLGLLISAW